MLCDCELGVIQQYNIYSKTATFFEKSGGNTYLGLAVALATWYNTVIITTRGSGNLKGDTNGV